jgi:protein-S-isoprenylcysteine O-methyltransferase Ste14
MGTELVFRLLFFVILSSTFLISATYRKRARDAGEVIERQEEGLTALLFRMGFALPLLAAILLYIFYPRAIGWSQIQLPVWLRALGAGVGIICVPIILWVFRSIGRNISETVLTKSEHELVTQGPYRWVRHPLYATSLLLLLSLSLVAESWFIFGYSVIGLIVFRFVVIPAEEAHLIASFGAAYQNYKSRTGALFPKLFNPLT